MVAVRVQTRLPQGDVYLASRLSIPALTRSTLHHCLERQDFWRLPRTPKQQRGQCAAYRSFH